MSAHGLPLDIVDRIMTFCPTFGTLQSIILVSKAFHRVFQTRPNSITQAVIYNIVGPALPQALRTVRYRHDYNRRSDDFVMDEPCPEDNTHGFITVEEQEKLQENSRVVAALEDVYSVTNKDRTSKTSVLTSDESWRFRRAMYRIMLYCKQFPGLRFDLYDDDYIEELRQQRTAALAEYPTDELLQLHSVVKFLRNIFVSLSGIDSPPTNALLSTGPSGALRAWEARKYGVLEDDTDFEDDMRLEDDENNPNFVGYLSLPFANIWTARNIAPPKEDEPASKWILDQVHGANDTCSQCSHPGGLNLYTEANWDRFPDILGNLLKENLKLNPTITQPFFAATAHLDNSDDLGPFIGDLFALRTTAFDGWRREDSYCAACLTRFLEEHLWVWWFKEQVKGGWTPPKDCWYGWNCRTQINKRSHADTKNHLCAPIKDDAT